MPSHRPDVVFHVDQPIDQVAGENEEANPNDGSEPLGDHVYGQYNDQSDTRLAPAFVKTLINLVGDRTEIPDGREKRCQEGQDDQHIDEDGDELEAGVGRRSGRAEDHLPQGRLGVPLIACRVGRCFDKSWSESRTVINGSSKRRILFVEPIQPNGAKRRSF